MIDIPRFAPLRITRRHGRPRRADFDSSDHVLVVMPRGTRLRQTAFPLRSRIEKLAGRARREPEDRASTRLENRRLTTLTVAIAPRAATAFGRLTWARKLAALTSDRGGKVAILVLEPDSKACAELVADMLSALAAAAFRLASFKTKQTGTHVRSALVLDAPEGIDIAAINAEAAGNDIARWLTALPPNKLDASGYRSVIEKLAAESGFEFEFFDEASLAELGAGAFLAVSQGNETRDAGIAKLAYRPGAAHGRIALAGKGIVFDTGGNNLKPFQGMLNMHMDMQGSAVALGLMVTLARLGVPYGIETWLAITENRVSARAYKSQDVVTAANGTTVQVIHTDAEGRMVLADTLALAGRSAPDLIIDFATLTGACITALTSRYSGVFSNREALHDALIAAGRDSGERVWPFPMDEDFDDALKSNVADIKQCAEDVAGDHILAAKFLQRFVPAGVPWIHIDLAAAHSKGGLAHIPTEFTGFGVRFTHRLLEKELKLSEGFAGLGES